MRKPVPTPPRVTPPLSVLIAEDDPVTRRCLEVSLAGWGYQPVCVNNGAAALAALRAPGAPAIAVLDGYMPGMDGPDVCQQLRATPDIPYPYLIILTSKSKPEDLVRALEAGADDFVSKPFDFDELRVRLRTGQRIVTLQAQLRELAERDMLTGLANRARFETALTQAVARAQRKSGEGGFALVLLDLDGFKQVNDTLGHGAGDHLLKEVATRLTSVCRSSDLLARLGGDEFVVLAHDVRRDPEIQLLAGRLLGALQPPVQLDSAPITVTPSIGVATFGQAADNGIDLLKCADIAMYRAKQAGRNQVYYFGQGLD